MACECVDRGDGSLQVPPQGCLVHGRAKDASKAGLHEACGEDLPIRDALALFGKTLDELTRRTGLLEKDSHPPMPLTIDGSPLAGLLDTFKAQISSLQQAVAAIERRQMPMLQSGSASDHFDQFIHDARGLVQIVDRKRIAAVTALHELAKDCDDAAVGLNRLTEDGARNDEHCRAAIRDVAVSLGDASALASKTARESA